MFIIQSIQQTALFLIIRIEPAQVLVVVQGMDVEVWGFGEEELEEIELVSTGWDAFNVGFYDLGLERQGFSQSFSG